MDILSSFTWFPVFVIATLLSFFLPGFLIVSAQKKGVLITTLLSFVLGLVLWGMQGYVFGYLQIRWATYVYLAVVFLISIFKRSDIFAFLKSAKKEVQGLDLWIFSLIALGVVVQLIPVAGSGLQYAEGIRFFGINSSDGVMHLAYIQSITHYFPPREPGAYGTLIQNYHYWSDLVIAELARIWLLPIPHLFFRYVPLFVSIMTGLAVYVVIRLLGGSKTVGLWGIVLNYFAGDAPFLFTLWLHRDWGFITPAIDNGALQFFNMPHAMAKMIFFVALIPLIFWLQKKEKYWGIISTILLASLVGFKVYFGIFVAIGFSLLVGAMIFHKEWHWEKVLQRIQKEWFTFLLLAMLGIIMAAIYLPPNRGSGGLYWDPLEWPRLLLGFGGVNMTLWWGAVHFVERMQLFYLMPILDIVAIIMALIIIYGTRIIGIFSIPHLWKTNSLLFIFLIPGVVLFQILGLFTMQVSGGLNVFNFFAVSAAVFTLLGAFVFESLAKGRYGKRILLLLLLITIPRVVYETGLMIHKYSVQDSYLVPNQELVALTYLKEHSLPTAIVQAHKNNLWDKQTPYVTFFTDRYSLLSGVGLQETHNTPASSRDKVIQELFGASDSADLANKMRQYDIDYLYLQKNNDQRFPYVLSRNDFDYVFENSEALIIKPKAH